MYLLSIKHLFLILLSIFWMRSLFSQQIYSKADLEILEEQKNYEEFFLHARDILPQNRDFGWDEMVLRMGNSYIKTKLNEDQNNAIAYNFIESIYEWPTLKKDIDFNRLRVQFGIKYFQNCKEKCLKDYSNFFNKNPDGDLGLTLGKILNIYDTNLEYDKWNYFKAAANSPFSAKLCLDETLKTNIIEKLSDLVEHNAKPDEIELTINNDCWKIIKAELREGLYSQSRNISLLSYTLLKIKLGLTLKEEQLFQVLFILNGPIIGKTFNESWNTLKKLSTDIKSREAILEELKKFDPLPGEVFKSFDTTKRKVIFKTLNDTFPEYLDFYAKTCLSYLKGTEKFPNGNPTVECKDFFQTATMTEWQNSSLLNELKAVPFFK
ncbi:MAG: hypothetical protein U0T83_03360 [Bacteriovoracaceae bacterium]